MRPRGAYGGYGGYGWGRRPDRPIETRPSFFTSEFVGTILAIIALGITAAAMDIVNARLTWILTAAMVVGYVVSRGLAKAGTPSPSTDPREQMLQGAQRRDPAEEPTQTYRPAQSWQQPAPYMGGWSQGWSPLETRPFFLSSEFAATLLAIVALACTAAAMPTLGARLTWILIAAMVATYAVSRGLAKAGTHSHSPDPRDELMHRGPGGQRPVEESNQWPPATGGAETRPFMVTSEFVGTVLAIIALAISAAAIDILNVRLTWILITVMVGGYVLSRGIAKIGVKSHSFDPRERVLQQLADDREQSDQHAVPGH
jgi:hypothetical protein